MLRLIFITILLFSSIAIIAQDKFIGVWYISSNSLVHQYYGRLCGIQISKTDSGGYYLKHSNEAYANYSPPEGDYRILKGLLVNEDGISIEQNGDKLLYDIHGNKITLRTIAYVDQIDTLFIHGVYYLEHTDTSSQESIKRDVGKCNAAMNVILAEDSECVGCYYNKTLGFIKTLEWDSAAFNYMLARKVRPDFHGMDSLKNAVVGCLIKAGWEIYGKNGDLKMAIKVYKKATQIDSMSGDAWYNLGGASYTIGQYKAAKTAFRKALEIDPTYEQARQGLLAVEEKESERKKK